MRNKPLIILLLLLALSPYFIACFYALPFADDFCYAWTSMEKIPFSARFMRQYLNCSGRYSAHVLLCNHPLVTGRLLYYQIADFIALLAVPAALFLLLKQVVQNTWNSLIIVLSILLFYLCYMPQLAEGVYWYTGICDYEIGQVCLALHLAFLLGFFSAKGGGKPISFFAAFIFLIASVGFDEIAAVIVPAYYLMALVVLFKGRDHQVEGADSFGYLIVLLVAAAIASAFLIFSPGNSVRLQQFNLSLNIIHSLFYASLQTVRFIGTWLATIPALALSLLVIVRAEKLPDTPLLKFSWPVIFAILLFTVFMSAFLPYYGTGILGQHRTINYSFFFFIPLWLWLLVSLSKRYSLYKKLSPYFENNRASVIITVCIIIMIFSRNGGNLLRDFRENNFMAYRQEFLQRQDDMIAHPGVPAPALKNVPASFKIADARGDSTWWVNKCMKFFYRDSHLKLQ